MLRILTLKVTENLCTTMHIATNPLFDPTDELQNYFGARGSHSQLRDGRWIWSCRLRERSAGGESWLQRPPGLPAGLAPLALFCSFTCPSSPVRSAHLRLGPLHCASLCSSIAGTQATWHNCLQLRRPRHPKHARQSSNMRWVGSPELPCALHRSCAPSALQLHAMR